MLKKISLVLLPSVLLLMGCGPDVVGESTYSPRPVYIAPGIGLGTIIAVVMSWTRNKSILWAIIHAFFGWFYVIYALIVGKKNTIS